MGWARMDDGYMDHPKVMDAGPWAELLDRRGIEHCAKYETDGLVSKSALRRISRDIPKAAQRVLTLIEVGRWSANENGGWLIHDYLLYNPAKADREAEREAGRIRQSRYRDRVRNGVTNTFVPKGRGGESVQPKMITRCERCQRLSVDCRCPALELLGGGAS